MYVTLDQEQNIIDPISQENIVVGGIAPNGKLFEYDNLIKNMFIKFTCPLTNMVYDNIRVAKVNITGLTADELELICENFMKGNIHDDFSERIWYTYPQCIESFKNMIDKKYTSVQESVDSDNIFRYNIKGKLTGKVAIAPNNVIFNDYVISETTIVINDCTSILFNDCIVNRLVIMGGHLEEVRFTNNTDNPMLIKLVNVNCNTVDDDIPVQEHFRSHGFIGTLIIDNSGEEDKMIYNINEEECKKIKFMIPKKVTEMKSTGDYEHTECKVR